jgi:CHAT domain-containing protein/predicted negative regulator of RcsB-dependent stress response
LLLFWTACVQPHQTPPEDFYQQALSDLRRGNLAAARNAIDKASALWADKPQSPWYWKYRVLRAEILTDEGHSQEAVALLSSEPPAGPDFADLACRWKAVRVKALFRLRRIEEARALLDAAESLAIRTKQEFILPELANLRGSIFDALRMHAEAESAYRAGLARAEQLHDLYWETKLLNNLGVMRIRQFRYDEAIPLLTRAMEGFEKMNAGVLASVALGNIGFCARYLGDFEKASAAYLKAVDVQEREGAKPYLEGSLGSVGNLYATQDEFAKAIPYYKRALALALEIGDLSDASKWAGNLAISFSELKDWDQAEKFNEQSRELKERIKDNESLTNTRFNAANIARGRRQDARAKALYEQVIREASGNPPLLWDAHSALAQLYRETGDRQKASEHFEAAIKIIEASRAELSQADYKITFLSRLIDFYRQYVDALIEQSAVDRALVVAESSRARVLAERLGRAVPPRRRVSSVESFMKAARESGMTFMAYWLAPARSFLWVITPKARKLYVLPPKAEIESLVRSYQAVVDASRDPLESVPPAAARLYASLIAPAQELLPSGSSVVIIPDGELYNLNFETLPVPGEKPHYWIEDATIAVAPSLAIPHARPMPVSLRSVLLIGNPAQAAAEYPPLPHAGAEIHNVEQRLARLQRTVYEGPQAEPSVYRAANPGKYSIIHFAAHALANRDSPLESAIILSPAGDTFKLYARDVMDTPLAADLVTLSACRSAGARVYAGEGLVGFTWAFLQAGARHVIAGLWDVNDVSTAQLMDQLYAQIGQGKSPVKALREAKLAMIHSQSNFRKPYYWGAFQVYVGGGTGRR